MPFQNRIGNSTNCACGLVYHVEDPQNPSQEETIPVPLKNVHIDARIIDFISEIKVSQSYVNKEENPIEAVYMFPVEEEAAVISFEAQVDKRKIVTKIKEKKEARKDYDEAIQHSKTAVLLEETQPDIFQIKLGHLKPNREAKIVITYVSELPVEDGKVKLTIPTTIAPRYVPPSDKSQAAKEIASIPYSSDKPAPLSFNFTGVAQSKVKSVKSPSHEFEIKIGELPNKFGQFTYSGELSIQTSEMDRDIILYIESHNPEEQNKPIVFMEKPEKQNSGQGFVGMLSLVPSFEFDEQLTEMIFLVDRSGSMSGSSMNQAKKAIELFLHSLPSDCYFNIWSFGSTYDALYTEGSTKYSDSTLNHSLQHVRQMSANYGGTEIYSPLRDIFQQAKPSTRYLRQIFVLTDGEVSNAPSIISLVRQNNAQGRVFSLGIGSSSSRYLVKGIARAGGGTAIFANQSEDLRLKVMNQLKNALQPAISNVTISWEDDFTASKLTSKDNKKMTKTLIGRTKSWKIYGNKMDKKMSKLDEMAKQVPLKIPPIFDGTRLLAYYFYSPESIQPTMINLKADSPEGPFSIDIPIDENNILQESRVISKLAARKKIQELEENVDLFRDLLNDGDLENSSEDEIKKTIIKLGLENSISSQYTSFVGIDHMTGKKLNDKPMYTREIKNQIALGSGSKAQSRKFCSKNFHGSSSLVKIGGVQMMQRRSRRKNCSAKSFNMTGYSDICSGPETFDRVVNCSAELDSPPLCSRSSVEQQSCVLQSSLRSMSYSTDSISNDFTMETKDKMTELINLQKSNGSFDVSNEDWTGSVLEEYLGGYIEVKSCCPIGFEISLWITALAIEIFKLKMGDKKELWDLVLRKSRKFLKEELRKEKGDYKDLIDQAEKYVKSR